MGEDPVFEERWKQASLELIKSNPESGFIAPLLHKHLESNGFDVSSEDLAKYLRRLKRDGTIIAVGGTWVSFGFGNKSRLDVYAHKSTSLKPRKKSAFEGDLFRQDLLTSLVGSGDRYKSSHSKKSKYDGVIAFMAKNPKRGFTVSSICEKFNLASGEVRNFLGKGKELGLHRVGHTMQGGSRKSLGYKVMVYQHEGGGLPHLSPKDAKLKDFKGKLFKV